MSEILKIVLSLSLSGALLILLLLLCKPLFRDRFSKRWQYYIWLVVIARLLLPFTPEISLVGILIQDVEHNIVQMDTSPAPEQGAVAGMPQSGRDTVGGHFAPLEGEALMASVPVPQAIGGYILQNVWLIWLMVALILLIRKITIYQGFVRYIKAGRAQVSDTALLDRLALIGQQAGVKKPVELYTNSLISSPLLLGFFRPCIVLPTADLADSDFGYIILHELTHYKRRDMFYKWLVQWTICLHWFNPLAYLMGRAISRACELACDEAVICKLDTKGQRDYGDTLLNAIAIGGNYRDSLASMTLNESKELLKERLAAMMKFKNPSKVVRISTAFLTIAIFLGATFTGAYAAIPNQTPSTERTKETGTVVFHLNSNGQNSIHHSSSFEAQANQRLVLDIQSSITGGTVDLFLFSPNGKEQRIAIGGSDKTETVTLTAGRWAYNCTGFFEGGAVSINGKLSVLEENAVKQPEQQALSDAPRTGVLDSKYIPTDYVVCVASEKIVVKQGGTAFKLTFDPASQNNYTIRDNTNIPMGERNYRFNKWDLVVERKKDLGTSAVFSSTITLTIPENLERSALYLQTTSGDIHIENLHNVNLSVESESGNVYGIDTSTDYISVESDRGNIKLTNVTSTGDIELRANTGSVAVQLGNDDRSYAVKVNTAPTASLVIDGKSYAGGNYAIGDSGKQTIVLIGQKNAFSLSNVRLFQEGAAYWTEAQFIRFMQEQEQAYKKLLASGEITQMEYNIYVNADKETLKSIQNSGKVSKSATGSIENGIGTGNRYDAYQKYGLVYNTAQERFYYNGKLVRYFEDIYTGDYSPNKRITIVSYKDGEMDVHTLLDESGEITGVEAYDQAGFDENTKKLADPMVQFGGESD